MSDTPRTDKAEGCVGAEGDWISVCNGGSTPVEFARVMERENNKMKEALEKFLGQFDCYECTGTAEECLDSLETDDIQIQNINEASHFSTLLPCPFCGQDDLLHSDRDSESREGNIYYVRCIKCDVKMMGKTELDTIQKWNFRANR